MRWAEQDERVMLVWQDECWFSRYAQPRVYGWLSRQSPLHLAERSPNAADKQPKALAVYGALQHDTRQVHLSFSDGQPKTAPTLAFIERLLKVARGQSRQVLIVVWDNASWHVNRTIRRWIHAYNQLAKHSGDVRLLVWRLPTRAPWLNPIEPHWVHAKRALCQRSSLPIPVSLLRRGITRYFQSYPLEDLFPTYLS